jgi:hypothetical protein
VRILLVSTYELGHQPLHLASPAAALSASGHEVSLLDVSVDPFSPEAVRGFDAIAVSVPMHTATRLAQEVVAAVRKVDSKVPIALYGLYAGEGSMEPVSARFVGEYEPGLVEWATQGAPAVGTRIALQPGSFQTPLRDGLPSLDKYGGLEFGGERRLVGYVEASHGCRHRCRHCPIPAVYDGRYRIVAARAVLDDIDSQVEAGARHITWGDPDFLNGPRHALPLLEEAHRRHPGVTHDLTIKVEHLRDHDDLLARLASAGTLFIVSAFETTDERTLSLLDKGHNATDMSIVVHRARDHGIEIHPSWMPFVPWTVPDDIVGIFRFLADHDLLGSTDPVQMSIRLLIPRGSLMLDLEEISVAVTGYDPEALSYAWRSTDRRSDELQGRFATLAESWADSGGDPVETLLAMWADAVEFSGGDRNDATRPALVTTGRPRLTESWFCCAEPTQIQSSFARSSPAG